MSEDQVTTLLRAWSLGDRRAAESVLPLIYEELRKIAAGFFRRRPQETLQPTALVHEVFLHFTRKRGIRWDDRRHFYGAAARAMRQILVDHYRARTRLKRGGGAAVVPLVDDLIPALEKAPDLVRLDDALHALEEVDREQAAVVELRYFGGLTLEEVADYLGISRATAVRRWRLARAWLYDQLKAA